MEDNKFVYRMPNVQDGGRVWELVRDSGVLELNSAYSYLMLFDMFRETCCVADAEGNITGFISAIRKPSDPETLFVWQVGVALEMRGQGVGKELIRQLLHRKENSGIHYLEATIGSHNIPSSKLFQAVAEELKTKCVVTNYYASGLFPGEGQHDDELLYRIGPFN